MKCDPSGAGRDLFTAGATLACRLRGTDSERDVVVRAARPHKGRLLLHLDGVDDANAAEAYVGAVFFAPRGDIVLEEGEYLDADLIGCAVEGVDGRNYGTVQAVEHYPASDMLVVAGAMLPMVGAFVRTIDVAGRRIVVDPPAGIFDD